MSPKRRYIGPFTLARQRQYPHYVNDGNIRLQNSMICNI